MDGTTTKKGNDLIVLGIILAVFVVINGVLLGTGSLKPNWDGFGLMVGAGFTIAVFSFLYKDNALFKLAEHVYVGVSAAYLFHTVWYDNLIRDLWFPLATPEPGKARDFYVLIPALLGVFLLTRLSRRLEFLSRISFAFITGFAAGQAIPNSIAAQILEQIGPTIQPLFGSDLLTTFNTFVILIGVLTVLVYFFFSVEHKGAFGAVSRVGVWFLMVSFGASFGYTVMARMSLLIGRISYLFKTWIPLIH